MSNSKYKWDDYLPTMINLYHSGLSIPKICAMIQDEKNGFTPSLSMVYSKFRSLNLPTDLDRKERLSSNSVYRWSADVPPGQMNTPSYAGEMSMVSPSANSPAKSQALAFSQHGDTFVQNEDSVDRFSVATTGPNQDFSDFQFGPDISWDVPRLPLDTYSHMTTGESAQWQGPQTMGGLYQCDTLTHGDIKQQNEPLNLTSHQLHLDFDSNSGSQPEPQGTAIKDDTNASLVANANPSAVVTDAGDGKNRGTPRSRLTQAEDISLSYYTPSPDRSSKSDESLSANTGSSIGSQLTSFFPKMKPMLKYNRSCSPNKRISHSSQDSAYASGRNSPMFSLMEADTLANPNSVREFKGLHRVPCLLHEPRALKQTFQPYHIERYKNTFNCAHCLYSGIHNLSWSTQYLKLTVFQAELKLDSLYEMGALDTAGNSALHYAATGGASFDHFILLMEVGVNPYRLNTAGQLFLHCLQPAGGTNREPVDDDSVSSFDLDLINLMNYFNTSLRWRDNAGRTVLDAISPLITSEKAKTQLQGAGYRLDTSSRPGSFRHPGSNSTSTNGNAYSISGVDNAFVATQETQKKAWNIFNHALEDPSYVDPDTGDNVLHALSRINFGEKNSLLLQLQKFIEKDVDLNHQNNNGDTPLISFVRERPSLWFESDETGATMSKYLDALLWKDVRNRVPNRINVNIRNNEGAAAIHYAATSARPHSIRSLIDAGANVNARIADASGSGNGLSVLLAARNAKAAAIAFCDELGMEHRVDQFNEVLSYLEHERARDDPTLADERRVGMYSLMSLPM